MLGMTLLLAVLAFKSDLNYYLTETTYDALAEISDDHEYFFQTHLDGAFNTLQAVALSYPEEERYGMEHFFGYVQRVVDTTDFQYFGVVEEDGTFTTNTGYQGSIYGQPLFEEVMRGESHQPADRLW